MRNFFQSSPLRWAALTAIAGAFAVYASTDFSLGGSSPLALLCMGIGGWLLQWRDKLVGHLLVLFAGGSLLAFPFLYEAPIGYSLLALPIALFGISGTLAWWKEEQSNS